MCLLIRDITLKMHSDTNVAIRLLQPRLTLDPQYKLCINQGFKDPGNANV